jgi:hypothetical protein
MSPARRAWARNATRSPAEAERILREASDVLEAHGETGVRSTLLGLLAEALYRLGRYDESERTSE